MNEGFVRRSCQALGHIADELRDAPPILVGVATPNPSDAGRPLFNSAVLLRGGAVGQAFHKSLLPTYDVFDEDRYFEPAKSVAPVEIAGTKFGITICEDVWTEKYLPRRLYGAAPIESLISQGAKAILNLSASPFSLAKAARRAEMLGAVARQYRVPIHYCNAIGGNDQLVFDGNSLAVDTAGTLHTKLAAFAEDQAIVELHPATVSPAPQFQSEPEELFRALSLGTRDYLRKCGFHSAVLGLSGGIDSAVTACIAADALGPQNVLGVTMPTQYSSPGSIDDSLVVAKNLGIRCETISIQRSFDVFREQFREIFAVLPEDATEENMQPRLRGMTLMALSNKFGSLLLTTGNKSEIAVGYCTLYGDMCGGLAVISDLPKTMVYRLAAWINRDREIIPRATIEKPPSAELKPNQVDQDTLPPYEILDPILQLYIEEQLSGAEIVARGFEEKTVHWVVRRVDLNEYKRAQMVPGLKVTGRAFGLGRKMPVAQRFVE
jgi:NAD+ synthetase